jgi:hypothetical protein
MAAKNSTTRLCERAIYHNGKFLFTTSEKGRITAATINGYLDKKEASDKDEKTYDRSKEVYTTKIKK